MEDWRGVDPTSLLRQQQERIRRLEARLEEYGRLSHKHEEIIVQYDKKQLELEARVNSSEMKLRERLEKLLRMEETLKLHIAKLSIDEDQDKEEPREEPRVDGPVTRFLMINYDAMRRGCLTWKSHPVYTHIQGYKLYIAVRVHRSAVKGKRSLKISVFGTAGEYDDKLTWPARFNLALEIVSKQSGQENLMVLSGNCVWNLPVEKSPLVFQNAGSAGQSQAVVDSKQLRGFVYNDRLEFKLSKSPLP